jgi:hypothetical protein
MESNLTSHWLPQTTLIYTYITFAHPKINLMHISFSPQQCVSTRSLNTEVHDNHNMKIYPSCWRFWDDPPIRQQNKTRQYANSLIDRVAFQGLGRIVNIRSWATPIKWRSLAYSACMACQTLFGLHLASPKIKIAQPPLLRRVINALTGSNQSSFRISDSLIHTGMLLQVRCGHNSRPPP